MSRVVPRLHLKGLSGHSTDDLMVLVQGGDALAFEALYYRVFPSLRGFIAPRARRPEPVDDCIQEVFCRVWALRGRFAGKSSAKTYLFGIALNVVRELSNRPRRPEPLLGDHAAAEERSDLDGGELSQAIRVARAALTNNQSRAIAMVYDQQISPGNAAKMVGCSKKAMRGRIERARINLYHSLRLQLSLEFDGWPRAASTAKERT